MYPYKINWLTESLREAHEDDSYGYVDDLFGIKKIIYKYIDEYIYECENRMKDEIINPIFPIEHNNKTAIEYYNDQRPIKDRFCEMVNGEPYLDYIFLSVKYFDFSLKTWCDYKVDETELNEYLLSHFIKIINV